VPYATESLPNCDVDNHRDTPGMHGSLVYVRSASPPAEPEPFIPPPFNPLDFRSGDSATHQSEPPDERACAFRDDACTVQCCATDDGNGMLIRWCGFATESFPLRDR
jgi:hypothetical protein